MQFNKNLALWGVFLALFGCDSSPSSTSKTCEPVPAGQIAIPAGSYSMGGLVYPEEGPITVQQVAAFAIDATEVTNRQFSEFVAATGYITRAERGLDADIAPGLPESARVPGSMVFGSLTPDGVLDGQAWWRFVKGASWRHPMGPDSSLKGLFDHPVVHITLEDAVAYADWRGRDIPTEIEWEYAARNAGTLTASKASQSPENANVWQGFFPVQNEVLDGFEGTAPVGCFPPSTLGLYDMVGNVWELTSSPYYPNHETQKWTSVHPNGYAREHKGAPVIVIKGGSHLCSKNYCRRYRGEARQPQDRYLGSSHVGFRTIQRTPTSR